MHCEGLQTPPVVFACPQLYFTRLHAGALFGCQNHEGATGCMKPLTTHMDCECTPHVYSNAQGTCHAVYQLLQTTEMSNSKDRIAPSHATNPLLSSLSCGVDGSEVRRISPIVRSRVAPSTRTAASRGVWRPQDSMAKQH